MLEILAAAQHSEVVLTKRKVARQDQFLCEACRLVQPQVVALINWLGPLSGSELHPEWSSTDLSMKVLITDSG